jgi:CspA family cold shock protein
MVQSGEGLWVHSALGGGKDVFVHISAVERAGLTSLNEGQTVEYEIVENRGKSSAENLKVSR